MSAPSSISTTSRFPLKDLFPKTKYKEAGKDGALHFLIAYGNPTEAWIEKLKKETPKLLDHQYGPLQITPLGVVAMKGDLKVAKQLIDAGCRVDLADGHLCTPFHYAAMNGDQAMIDLLLEASKVENVAAAALRNQWGATYEETQHLFIPQFPPADQKVFLYQTAEGDIVSGTAAEFEQMTGAKYSDRIFLTPEFLIEEWLSLDSSKAKSEELNQILKQKYEIYLQKPPELYLVKNEAIQGYDVYTNEDIAIGQVIVPYSGLMTTEKHPGVAYHFDGTEAIFQRNLGPMINDGLPNCFPIPMSDVQGIPRSEVFIALKDLPKGTRLLWNYGISYSGKFQHHLELNAGEMETAFKKTPLKEFVKAIQKISKNRGKKSESLEQILSNEEKISKLRYLIHTPSAIVSLIIKGIINGEELARILKDPTFVSAMEIPENMLLPVETSINIATQYQKIQKDMQKKNSKIGKEMIDLVDQLFSETSVVATLETLQLVAEQLPGNPSRKDWSQIKEDLLKGAKNLANVRRLLSTMAYYGDDEQKFGEIQQCIQGIPDRCKGNFLLHILDSLGNYPKQEKRMVKILSENMPDSL